MCTCFNKNKLLVEYKINIMIWSGYNHTIWFPCRNVAAYWEGVKCRVEGKACPKCSWKENSAPAEGEGRMRVWTMYQHLLTHIPTSQQRVTQQHWLWVLIHNPSLGTLVRPPPPPILCWPSLLSFCLRSFLPHIQRACCHLWTNSKTALFQHELSAPKSLCIHPPFYL